MTEYLVTWQIFVEARSPEEAARGALAAQRDPDSTATCFEVCDDRGNENTVVCPMEDEATALEALSHVGRHLRLVKTTRA